MKVREYIKTLGTLNPEGVTAEDTKRIVLEFSCLFVEQHPDRSVDEELCIDETVDCAGMHVFTALCRRLLTTKEQRDDFRSWLTKQKGGEVGLYLMARELESWLDRIEWTDCLLQSIEKGCKAADEYMRSVLTDESMDWISVIRTYALLLVLESRGWGGAQEYLLELKGRMSLDDFEEADFLASVYESNGACPPLSEYFRAEYWEEIEELSLQFQERVGVAEMDDLDE